MIRRPRQKIIAALTVCHGIYKKATFILNGQPVLVQFLSAEEYRELLNNLSAEEIYERIVMIEKIDRKMPIFYCQWTVNITEYHLITNKIQELIDQFIPGDVGTFEMDIDSVVLKKFEGVTTNE